MGVEPTRRPSRSVHAGFEDQGGHRTPCASAGDSTRPNVGPSVTRVLFVEARDEAALRDFASGLSSPWRLLSRPEQGLFLLEATGAGAEAESAAGELPGVRAWAFDVVDEDPGG